jgi:hypothetical protein
MSITKVLNEIYVSKELSSEIIYFFDKIEINTIKVSKDFFEKFYKKNNIDMNPCRLFDFFDEKKIKIAIMPVSNTEFWSGRIYLYDKIISMNDYVSRKDATIGALERAIIIYNEKKYKI